MEAQLGGPRALEEEDSVMMTGATYRLLNRKMMFGHDGIEDASIFKFGDQWQSGIKVAGDINEPLDVAQHDGKFWS